MGRDHSRSNRCLHPNNLLDGLIFKEENSDNTVVKVVDKKTQKRVKRPRIW